MNYTHSIRFKINIIFIVAFLAVGAMVLFSSSDNKREFHLAYLQVPYIENIINKSKDKKSLEDELKNLDIKLLKSTKDVLFHKKLFISKKTKNRDVDIYYNQNDRNYLYLYFKVDDVLIRLNKKPFGFEETVHYILLFLLLLILIMYILIRRSFKPLKKIQKALQNYSREQIVDDIRSKNKDEISNLANAFYGAIEQNKELLNARTLFMRNILHELNTPITKGRLIAAMSKEDSHSLDKVFSSLESYIKEMAEIEKITSKQYKPSFKNYPVVELIDNACDMLFLQTPLNNDIRSQKLRCDFTMMSIVFKNLIDNALKYGENLKIYFVDEKLIFQNDTQEDALEFERYIQAFTQENNNENGFGLGLYICNEFLKQQGYLLEYTYEDKIHRFEIITRR